MADYSVDVNNSGSVDVDSDVHLDGLDNINVDTTLHGGTTLNSESDVTLHSDATARLTLDPVTTSSTTASTIDLDEARKLINALAGLITAGAPEISDMHARSLRDGLRSLQLAFREASVIPDAIGQGPGEKWTGPVN